MIPEFDFLRPDLFFYYLHLIYLRIVYLSPESSYIVLYITEDRPSPESPGMPRLQTASLGFCCCRCCCCCCCCCCLHVAITAAEQTKEHEKCAINLPGYGKRENDITHIVQIIMRRASEASVFSLGFPRKKVLIFSTALHTVLNVLVRLVRLSILY